VNRAELKQILQNEGIRSDVYDLEGGHDCERLTLRESHGLWYVYYSERGLESGLRVLFTEHDACEYLLKLLQKDSSAHTNE
jgi:hypothetical protein